jgi:hypothetical protein
MNCAVTRFSRFTASRPSAVDDKDGDVRPPLLLLPSDGSRGDPFVPRSATRCLRRFAVVRMPPPEEAAEEEDDELLPPRAALEGTRVASRGVEDEEATPSLLLAPVTSVVGASDADSAWGM